MASASNFDFDLSALISKLILGQKGAGLPSSMGLSWLNQFVKKP
jgi:hypothetical protein